MADTIAKRIVDAVATRLSGIVTGAGYNTDAGNQVYTGRRSFDASDPLPALSVWMTGEDTEPETNLRFRNQLSIDIEGFALIGSDAHAAAHALLGDVKKALYAAEVTLGGLANNMIYTGSDIGPPDDGSGIVTITARIVVEYDSSWNDPYTPV